MYRGAQFKTGENESNGREREIFFSIEQELNLKKRAILDSAFVHCLHIIIF